MKLEEIDALTTPTQKLMDAMMDLMRLSRSFADNETLRLNQVQYAILTRLSDREDSTLTVMSEELGYDLSVLSRQAAQLTQQGLVCRAKDPHDGRAWKISLTDQGRERLARSRANRIALLHQALAPYTDQERLTAAQVLASLSTVLFDALRRKGLAPAQTP